MKAGKSKLQKCGIDSISPALIAYISVLVSPSLTKHRCMISDTGGQIRSALSSEPRFDVSDHAHIFDYVAFYDYIVEYFAKEADGHGKTALDWWNQ